MMALTSTQPEEDEDEDKEWVLRVVEGLKFREDDSRVTRGVCLLLAIYLTPPVPP